MTGGQWSGRQRLEIKRGDCPATTVMTIDSTSVPDTTPCENYGRFRDGASAAVVGAFQRLGVTPDGRTVLFELNTHAKADPANPGPSFAVPEEGIFAVGPDDQIRRLGPPSRERAYRTFQSNVGTIVTTYRLYFSFSPNGRFVAFSDRGPGADGSDAAQIVVMTLPDGERRQVTHFVGSHQGNPTGDDTYAVFLDDETLGMYGYGEPGSGYFAVHPDGTGLESIEVPSLGTNEGTINPTFAIAGAVGTTVAAAFPTLTTEPVDGHVVEILYYGGPNRFLQLTRFGRSDTQSGPSLNTGERVFFLASANPFPKKNPQETCQLFSIGRLGSHLRQLTSFKSAARSSLGCFGGSPSPLECRVAQTAPPQYDARARALVFDGTCDLSGLHPVGGQVFVVRPDGSGQRQLTDYRGTNGTAADGTLSVELPGPIASSGEIN